MTSPNDPTHERRTDPTPGWPSPTSTGHVNYTVAFVEELIRWLDKQGFDIREYIGSHSMRPDQNFTHVTGVPAPTGQDNNADPVGALVVRSGLAGDGPLLRTRSVGLSRTMGNQMAGMTELVMQLSTDLGRVRALMAAASESNRVSAERFNAEFDETLSSYEQLRQGPGPDNNAPNNNEVTR